MRTFSWLSKQALRVFFLLVVIDIVFFELSYLNDFLAGKTVPLYVNLLILLIYGVLLGIAWSLLKYLFTRIDKGITGEDAVRSILYKLPKENFYVLPDVVIGKQGNIDFVVIGKTGVWTIEVKNHKAGEITINDEGKLCRNGYPINSKSGKNVLSQAYIEADGLQTFLRESLGIFTPVHPAVVFANKKTELHFGYNRQKGVFVIGIPFLMNLLQKNNYDESFTYEKRLKIKEELWKYTSRI